MLEPTRIIADWLAHETYGVNALIPRLPVDLDDDRPPPVAQIRDPTRDPIAGRENPGLDLPALIIAPDGPQILDGEVFVATEYRDAEVSISVTYFTFGDIEPDIGQRNGYLTLEAAAASIGMLNGAGSLDDMNDFISHRTRNGVTLKTCTQIMIGPLFSIQEFGELTGLISGAMVLDYEVRDSRPLLELL